MRELEINYDGDIIREVKFRKGQNVRPLWNTLESLRPEQIVLWVDRFDSLCPIACEWSVVQALEESAGVLVPQRLQFVRSIYAEVNRLIYLTTYLGEIIKILGYQTAFQQLFILREQVFQKQEELMGGRILPQVFSVGGVRRDLALGDVQKVRQFIQGWRFGWDRWKDLVIGDPVLESRLEGLLPISVDEVLNKAFWGIVGKAAGVIYDSRIHQPHGAYAYVDFNYKYNKGLNGDGLSRFNVAVYEIELTLSLTEQFLQNISSEVGTSKEKYHYKEGLYSGSSESAKGPVTALLEIDKSERVRSIKIFNSSQRVWPKVEKYFSGVRGEDFELAWASLGISGEAAEI